MWLGDAVNRVVKLVLISFSILLVFVSIGIGTPKSTLSVNILSTDQRLVYGGRWVETLENSSPVMRADWTVSSVWFSVEVGSSGGAIASVWYGARVRLNVTVFFEGTSQVAFWRTFVGPGLENPFADGPSVSWLAFPPTDQKTNYSVRIRKITTASPFGTGIGLQFFRPSVLRFLGLGKALGEIEINRGSIPWKRKIIAIGASDTAGYCVDGSPQTKGLDLLLSGWKYENAGMSYPSILGDSLGFDVEIEGISGIGITQNANAKEKWQLGSLTMIDFFKRTLQTDSRLLWDFSRTAFPTLVTVSLGGNDYNHQRDLVPSNATFFEGYDSFLSFLFKVFPNTIVVVLCGMGDPHEKEFDPDNNRCRPCPHVESAVDRFRKYNPLKKVHSIFVPCDGSVVTGEGDIGCNGHKNRIGQERVAKFLIEPLASILELYA